MLCGAVWAPGGEAEQAGSKARSYQAGLLDAGSAHSCGLMDTGNVRCWGLGGSGQLGTNATSNVGDNNTDRQVQDGTDVPLSSDAVAIAAGAVHTCALLDTGRVRCWGTGNSGQLGTNAAGTIGDNNTDRQVQDGADVPLASDALAITAGDFHTCALLDTRRVRCWGFGGEGRLGTNAAGTIGDNNTDRQVQDGADVPLASDAVAITAGDRHTCALLDTGKVRCWGDGSSGRLGTNATANVGDNNTDRQVQDGADVPLASDAVAITAGDRHTCALLDTGKVRCWGDGNAGQLGTNATTPIGFNNTTNRVQDGADVPLASNAVAITAGNFHTCALLDTGKARCWGSGGFGQLGTNATTNIGDNNTDRQVQDGTDVPLSSGAVAITAGSFHTCALLDTGKARCWGSGGSGRLGTNAAGNIGDNDTDRRVQDGIDVPLASPLISAVADLSLSADVATPVTTTGGSTTLTVSVTNGGADPATAVTVLAPVPAETTLTSSNTSQGTYSAPGWSVGTLAPGASATLTLGLSTPSAGTRSAAYEISTSPVFDPDSAPGNGLAGEDDRDTVTITTNAPPPPVGPPSVIGPPDRAATCRVPRLKKLTLKKARAALKKARCKAGKIKKPKRKPASLRRKRTRLVVKSSSPAAGRTVPAGTAVKLSLKHVKRK